MCVRVCVCVFCTHTQVTTTRACFTMCMYVCVRVRACVCVCLCVCVSQVSPHEFMQSVITSSKRRFTIEAQSDPVEFWSWLLNALHFDLTGGKVKKRSIITDCFQVGVCVRVCVS